MKSNDTDNSEGINLFNVSIDIPYDIRFIKPAQEWTAQITSLAGGNRQEAAALSLAVEETLTFIITAYTDVSLKELIHIDLTVYNEGDIKVSISNAGPPVHLDRIPEFDPDAPLDSSSDGLWYFLARKMVDNLEFENRGMGGWRAEIKKNLTALSFEKLTIDKKPNETSKTKVKFEYRFALPQDAGELVDLTYDTYRYSYTAPEFYDKSKLRHMIENKEIISILATTDEGIAGNISIFAPTETPECGYIGTLMVRRKFRRSMAILLLLKEIKLYANNNKLNKDLYCALMATAHPLSQTVSAKQGLLPLALQLSAGSKVDYRAMTASKDSRESFLFGVFLPKPPELKTLYMPEAHHDVMKGLMSQVGCNMPLSYDEAGPGDKNTTFSIQEDRIEHHAYIKMNPGIDWVAELRKKIFGLTSGGMEAITTMIPAWEPIVPEIDKKMSDLNTLFCGIKPVSAKEYYLVYCTIIVPVDFDQIQIADPLAVKLKEHIRNFYIKILPEYSKVVK